MEEYVECPICKQKYGVKNQIKKDYKILNIEKRMQNNLQVLEDMELKLHIMVNI